MCSTGISEISDDNGFIPLNVSQKVRQRIFVGLGWDPNETKVTNSFFSFFLNNFKQKHDLDLSCYTFNEHGEVIDFVIAKEGKHIDQSGRLYHSGDNKEGLGDGDDEQISVELKNLDANIYHIIFVVTLHGGAVFADVKAPSVRLADGYTGRNFLMASLTSHSSESEKAENASDYVFVHIKKEKEKWFYRFIGEKMNVTAPEKDWSEILPNYIKLT